MSDFKTRMIEEYDQLSGKLVKLKLFLWSEAFGKLDNDAKTLLIQQAAHMDAYRRVLGLRIDLVEKSE